MWAWLSERCGPPETLVLRQAPEPSPGPGQVRIAVEACGINYPDVLMVQDRYQFVMERPFSPGIEICGRIDAIGAGVEGVVAGARVVAQVPNGGLAEKAVADARQLVFVPDGVSAEQAAGLLLTYCTSWHALEDRAALKAGETLLVLGAGGGVGLAAVELGKQMGARVVAAASSPEKAEKARAAGADQAIVYPATIDQRALAAQFKAACPQGADVIYDPVGGDHAEPAFRAIGWGGRYLVVGFASGIPRLPLNLVLLKGAQVIGVFWGDAQTRDPTLLRRTAGRVLGWVADGTLAPQPPTLYPMSAGKDAITALARREAVGKLVVKI